MVTDFEALVAFVIDNWDGLRMVRSFDNAQAVIERLIKAGMEPKGLVWRAAHPKFGDELLPILVGHFEKNMNAWQNFIKALASYVTTESDPCFRSQTIRQHILSSSACTRLISDSTSTIRNAGHPLCQLITPSDFWTRRVRWYIVKGDYRRAWDELKKAGRGIPDRGDYSQIDILQGNVGYTFSASDDTIALLTRELYRTMVEKKLIAEIPEGDFALPSSRVKIEVHEVRSRSDKRYAPRSFARSADLPGFEFARKHLLIKDGNEYQHRPYIFKCEGGMLLKIAEYVQGVKNQSRLKRHEHAVEEYEKQAKKQ